MNFTDQIFFKQKIKSYKSSMNPLKKALYIIALFFWNITVNPIKFIFSSEYRALLWLQYFSKKDIHQVSNYTEYNRYPNLFSACRELIGNKKNLKILSYGCSTGEEVFTLREYFPNASIVGVDINTRNIKKATKKNKDQKIIFSHEIEKTLEENAPFDIIFALAVLQKTKNREEGTLNSNTIYPFKQFNEKITELDSYLNKDGLFVIDHADYLFEDTKIASYYHAYKGEHNIIRNRHMFHKNNQRMKNHVMLHRIFIKTPIL